MKIEKSRGIVLASRDSGEADRVVRILTREQGKRAFVFKGLRKSRKRAHVAGEMGTVIDLVYYYHEERNFHVVNESTVLRHYHELRDDYLKISVLFLISEIVDRTTGVNDPNPRLYDLTLAGLETLVKTEYHIPFTVFFLLHLLRLDGILPDMTRCGHCGAPAGKGFRIDTTDLSIRCHGCRGGTSRGSFDSSMAVFLSDAVTKRFSDIDAGVYSGNDMLNLLFTICLFLENYFHITIKSKEMLFSTR